MSYVWLISLEKFLLNDQYRSVKIVVKKSDDGKVKYTAEEKESQIGFSSSTYKITSKTYLWIYVVSAIEILTSCHSSWKVS